MATLQSHLRASRVNPGLALALAGSVLLLAGVLGAASQIASTIEVSLAVLLLVIAHDQRRDARGRYLLVGRLSERRLLRLAAGTIVLYALVAWVDFASAPHAPARSIAGTAASVGLAILVTVGVALRSSTGRRRSR